MPTSGRNPRSVRDSGAIGRYSPLASARASASLSTPSSLPLMSTTRTSDALISLFTRSERLRLRRGAGCTAAARGRTAEAPAQEMAGDAGRRSPSKCRPPVLLLELRRLPPPTWPARGARHAASRSAKLMERATAVDHAFRPFSRPSQAQRRSEDGGGGPLVSPWVRSHRRCRTRRCNVCFFETGVIGAVRIRWIYFQSSAARRSVGVSPPLSRFCSFFGSWSRRTYSRLSGAHTLRCGRKTCQRLGRRQTP